MVISSCCSYYQLQLCIAPPAMVFGKVKQTTIYALNLAKFLAKRSSKKKIIPWLTEDDDVINITPLLPSGAGIFC